MVEIIRTRPQLVKDNKKMDKLVLFDIDKTLTRGARGHHVAFSMGFKDVFGIDADIDEVEHEGMTDWQIITEVLKNRGIDEKIICLKMMDCMRSMVDYFDKVVAEEKMLVLGGVPELLEELKENNILIGLVTGNLEPIARAKMKKVNLNDYFKLGGFGSDDINRANLVRLAIKRAEDLGFIFENNVFLVGDALRDVKAGREAGVKIIGVATGRYSREELLVAGADFATQDLKNKEEILKIILK